MKRRERIIINRTFQWRMIALVTGMLLALCLLLGSFAWFQYQIIQQALAGSPGLLDSINNHIFYYVGVTAVSCLLVLTLTVLLTIRITHRVVGPVNRLRDELELMQKKDEVSVLAVRDDDELQDLVKAINRVILHMQDRD